MIVTAKAKYVSHPPASAGRIRVTWKDATGKHTRHVGNAIGAYPAALRDAVALAMGVSPGAVTATDVMDASNREVFTVNVPA